MVTLNYREVLDRFHHIDAGFVASSGTFREGSAEASYTVRFYPYWEHPAYLADPEGPHAQRWEHADHSGRELDVVVRALRPRAAKRSEGRDLVLNWWFSDTDAVLWEHQPISHLHIDGVVATTALIAAVERRKIEGVRRHDLVRYLDPCGAPELPATLLLPYDLLGVVESELGSMKVPCRCPKRHPRGPALVALRIHDHDYIIAEDFEVDVPDFIHDPAWFANA